MPRQVNIEIFNIARTTVDRAEVQRWLNYLEANEYVIPTEDTISNPALLIALAAKRCYKSFEPGLNPNVTKVRKDMVAYFDNVLESGHGSVLEHAVYSFAIEGVSRVFTEEMVRHRAGWGMSLGSLRYIRFSDELPFWMPTSLQPDAADDADLARRKTESRQIFMEAFAHQEQLYGRLLDIWDMHEGHHNFHYKKKVTSCLRRIIGMGVATGGVWTGNLRALRHVIALRANSEAAEEEIYHVFSRIAEYMREQEPLLFGDFSLDQQKSWVPRFPKV